MFIVNFNKNADLFVKRHLWKMYSRNTCNTQCIKPIHKQRRNDFARETAQCVDLCINDEMQPQ